MEAAHPPAQRHPDVDRRQVVQRAAPRAPASQISRSPGPAARAAPRLSCWVTRAAPLNHRAWKASTGSAKSRIGLLDVRAELGEPLHRPPHRGGDRRVAPRPGRRRTASRRSAAPRTPPARPSANEPSCGGAERRPVAGVGAADHVHQQRRVRRVPGHRADVRERAEGARGIQRHPAVRRLQREDPAERGRDTDRAARRPCRGDSGPAPSATAAALPPLEPPAVREGSYGLPVTP